MQYQNLFSFSGRATRKSYWLEVLLWTAIGLVLNVLIAVTSGTAAGAVPSFGMLGLAVLYGVAVNVAMFSVTVRRLHDTGRTGWYWLRWSAVVLLGAAFFFVSLGGRFPAGVVLSGAAMLGAWLFSVYVLGIERGTEGDNSYGAPGSGSVF